MGVATKSRAKSEPKAEPTPKREVAQREGEKPLVRRVQITMSEKTWGRLRDQSDDIGISIAQYATLIVAQTTYQQEQTKQHMPNIMQAVGLEVGKRIPMDECEE